MASFSFSCWEDLTVEVGTVLSLTQSQMLALSYRTRHGLLMPIWVSCPCIFLVTPSLLSSVLKGTNKLAHAHSYSLEFIQASGILGLSDIANFKTKRKQAEEDRS